MVETKERLDRRRRMAVEVKDVKWEEVRLMIR